MTDKHYRAHLMSSRPISPEALHLLMIRLEKGVSPEEEKASLRWWRGILPETFVHINGLRVEYEQ